MKESNSPVTEEHKVEYVLTNYDISYVTSGYMTCRGALWGLLDQDGIVILPCEYEQIIPCQIDSSGNMVVKWFYHIDENYDIYARHDKDGSTSCTKIGCGHNYVFICKYNGRYGILNKNLSIMVPFEFEDLEPLHLNNNFGDAHINCAVKCNGKWGLFSDGHISIQCKYDLLTTRYGNENFFIIMEDGKMGIIDKNGAVLVPCSYDDIRWEKETFLVHSNGKTGLYEPDGKPAIPCLYDVLKWHSPASIKAVIHGKVGLWIKSKIWKQVLPSEFDDIQIVRTSESFLLYNKTQIQRPIIVTKNGSKGMYDLRDKEPIELVPTIFDSLQILISKSLNFSDNVRIIVRKDGFFGSYKEYLT